MNTNILIPQKCKVGFNPRQDTYTGMLGYIIYNDGKVWRKEKSWDGWIYNYMDDDEYESKKLDAYNEIIEKILNSQPRGSDNKCTEYTGHPRYWVTFDPVSTREEAEKLIPYREYVPNLGKTSNNPKVKPFEFENVPMEGFVLNKKAGGNNTGWNHRNTYCRVYDPRGFEIEITIPNLLYILENSNSIRGKGLEGKFVYGWQGTELVLIPEQSPEFEEMIGFTKLQEMNLTKKELIPGGIYISAHKERLTYLGDGFEYSKYQNKLSSAKKMWFNRDNDKGVNYISTRDIKDIKKYTGEMDSNYVNLMDQLVKRDDYYNGDKNSLYVEIENPYNRLLSDLNHRTYYNSNLYYIKINNKFLEIKINSYKYNDYVVIIKGDYKKYNSIKDILNKYTLWEIKMTK